MYVYDADDDYDRDEQEGSIITSLISQLRCASRDLDVWFAEC